MTPNESYEAQIEKYRRMTGQERLLVGLRLHELSCEIAREGIKAMRPDASDIEVAAAMRERLKLAYRIGERTVAR